MVPLVALDVLIQREGSMSRYSLGISDVLGWASSPEPAEPSPFKPEPGRALMRACNGLGLGFRYWKPEPGAQARALIYCSLAPKCMIGKVKYYLKF